MDKVQAALVAQVVPVIAIAAALELRNLNRHAVELTEQVKELHAAKELDQDLPPEIKRIAERYDRWVARTEGRSGATLRSLTVRGKDLLDACAFLFAFPVFGIIAWLCLSLVLLAAVECVSIAVVFDWPPRRGSGTGLGNLQLFIFLYSLFGSILAVFVAPSVSAVSQLWNALSPASGSSLRFSILFMAMFGVGWLLILFAAFVLRIPTAT